jgi:hypothetical protein
MGNAAAEVNPPDNVPLDAEDMPFFRSVIDEFARSEWTSHQLELAAMLARKMRDMKDVQRELRDEGYTTTTANGTPVQSPLVGVLRMLDTSILATRRSLSLHARARAGEARDVAKRRGAAKAIESDNPLEDDLLARPE